MRPDRFNPRWSRIALRVMLAVPFAIMLVVMAGMVWGGLHWPHGLALLLGCAAAAYILWRGAIGKYVVLTACLFGWVMASGAVFVSLWGGTGFAVAALLTLCFTVLAYVAALPWAASRMARLDARGRGTIEWEWVYLPRSFARGHRFYRAGVGIYLTAIAILLSTGFAILMNPWSDLYNIPILIFMVVTLFFMAVKGAVASPLVYLSLLQGLPFSIPFIVYWADGVRPNLIYRHRFERLCVKEKTDV